ncbi:type II secretion system F family protein [Polycladidibacter stylochi]|uniref:type II secretion system F family protein n=1 Tax=Polycladidibacter stylochi TaxID=1807766 RepID=UPI00082DBFBF|nr:type II secretion system F family protein [Pseudovibrio stylochi]
MDVKELLVILLVTLSVGGLLFVVALPYINGERRQAKRVDQVARKKPLESDRLASMSQTNRKKNIQDQLKAMEEKQAAKRKNADRPAFADWIAQAGLNWNRQKFYLFSAACSLGFYVLSLVLETSMIVSLAFALNGFLGFPRWFVSRQRKRRFNRFLDEFPNSVDVIVRGVKSGLPLNDCIQIIAREAKDPVSTEFQKVIENQQLGVPLSEAIQGLANRVPLAEANFFAIVIAIQSEAGGSLSEALGNLSKVLRGRKAMQGKVKAVSQEAKTSAWIIGSMPVLVALAVYMLNPDYIMKLFIEDFGNLVLLGCAIWMAIGVLVMRKMINFDI